MSCSPQPKWRPYVAQLVYEQSSSSHASPLWQGPRYNSFHGHLPAKSQQQQQGLDCLEPLGIEFGELRLLRVQKRPFTAKFSTAETHGRPRVELYFGSLPPNAQSRRSHRPTSLQSTALLRMDTVSFTFLFFFNTLLKTCHFEDDLKQQHNIENFQKVVSSYSNKTQ